MKTDEQPFLVVYPFGVEASPKLSREEIDAERALVRQAAEHPALRALVRMIERRTHKLQATAIQPDATDHERGQAYGAGVIYTIARAWLEAEPEREE